MGFGGGCAVLYEVEGEVTSIGEKGAYAPFDCLNNSTA